MNEIIDKIASVLADQLSIDKASINENSKIVEDLGADSLDVVELLITVEETYNITVSDDEAAGIVTVGDIASLLSSKIK